MIKGIIAFGIFVYSILYALIWSRLFYFSYNFRKIDEIGYYLMFPVMFIGFLLFGIYINTTICQFFIEKKISIPPSKLSASLYFSIMLFVLTICIVAGFGLELDIIGLDFWTLGIILIFQILVIRKAFNDQTNPNVKTFGKQISTALLVNVAFLMVVCINDFPGVNAPIEARQKWAYKEGYSGIVNLIKRTDEFTDQVGQIKFVAPTKGPNLVIPVRGSSVPSSEVTYEVVGEKGTGIAHITTWGETTVLGICFEYQGKKTKLWSPQNACENSH